jgi:hypothetical protein
MAEVGAGLAVGDWVATGKAVTGIAVGIPVSAVAAVGDVAVPVAACVPTGG